MDKDNNWQLPPTPADYAERIVDAKRARLYATVERLMPSMPQAQKELQPFLRAVEAGDEAWDPTACEGGGFTIIASADVADLVDALLRLAGWATHVENIGFCEGRTVTVRRPRVE